MSTLQIIITVLAIIVLFYALPYFDGQWLRLRPKHPKLWLNAYSEAQHGLVNEALGWICFSFGLPDECRFALRPSETIRSIYRRFYSENARCDNMEYEELYGFLEKNGHATGRDEQ